MVRQANKFDLETICDLLQDYCVKHPNDSYKDSKTWNREFAKKQLIPILAGAGFILIDENNKGLLIAAKVSSFWIPNVFILQELVWYGLSKRISMELLNKFLEIGDEMKDKGEVADVCFTCINEVKFERLGLKKAGHNWVI